MKNPEDEIGYIERTQIPVVFRMSTSEFQQEVLAKLGRLEAQMDMVIGNGQPGRMRLAEERITALEKSDIRRSVYDRLVNAAIAVAISAGIALHDHLGIR
jgi:pyrrolidone-carboxylate peptidase